MLTCRKIANDTFMEAPVNCSIALQARRTKAMLVVLQMVKRFNRRIHRPKVEIRTLGSKDLADRLSENHRK